MRRFEALIFATGAVTLSLEVLASRIMTPYFGVSLYIWTGILSITLTFLAIGYHFGGRLSRRLDDRALEICFLATPIVSAASIAFSAAVYPAVFPMLSQMNLIAGSFIGATLLLALPLIALSAMNPLLIGLRKDKSANGDAGAGRVFFVSTVGSVAGVLLTAFVFIPNLTNFRAMLLLGLAMCAAAALFARRSDVLSPRGKRDLYLSSLVVASICAILLVGKNSYLRLIGDSRESEIAFHVRAEYTSMFGNIKVVEAHRKDGTGVAQKIFLQDGLVQNRTDLDDVSLSMYTYALESLGHAFVPGARDALVLGLGAGIVPRNLKRDGIDVSVVEINARTLTAAEEHFGFDADGIAILQEDARTFVGRCESSFDVVFVDLFLGDSTPDYLLTREFFHDLRRCIRPGGAMIMNAFLDDQNEEPNRRLFATVLTAFPNLFLFGKRGGNAFIVGASGKAPARVSVETVEMPVGMNRVVDSALSNKQRIRPEYYAGVEPVSDEQNIFSLLFADANMKLRQIMVGRYPPFLLVN
ncbi:MAG: fused MFS/spermidine synthase [Proteobacteria bacterium]|nr:fused MFS/spermidine synthase [Pseudomonadota bacterium]